MSHKFEAQTFIACVEKKLAEGKVTLDWLIDAYHWAADHLAEVLQYAKGFTLPWLRDRIIALYNINPSIYERLLSRFGGDSEERVKRVKMIVNNVGISPLVRADKMLLSSEQKRALVDDLPEKVTSEIFRKKVDERHAEAIKQVPLVRVRRHIRAKPGMALAVAESDRVKALEKEKEKLQKKVLDLQKKNSDLQRAYNELLAKYEKACEGIEEYEQIMVKKLGPARERLAACV